jgi:glycosyltransferase involved in cell wall biosynthesis
MLSGLLSLVIPAHNEAANIDGVIRRCCAVLPTLASQFEIVLVDDGSSDGTAEVARQAMGSQVDRLRVVRHQRKSGYGITVADGLRASQGEFVAFMDGDGQFDIGDLRLLTDCFADADLAAGWRRRRADPWFRSLISGVFNILVRLLYGIHYRDIDCGLKVMRRSVLEAASPLQARSALLNTELYFKSQRSGLRIVQVPVPHHPRVAGVRSGARLIPILRAIRDLVRLRLRLYRSWRPPRTTAPAVAES